MLTFLCFNTHHNPPCNCETTFYKRKRSTLPCIIGILKDSASEKPLIIGALDINGVITRANQQGRTYAEVTQHKYKVVAKVYAYYFCTKTLSVNQGDSIVCVFHMRKNRKPEE